MEEVSVSKTWANGGKDKGWLNGANTREAEERIAADGGPIGGKSESVELYILHIPCPLLSPTYPSC